MAQLIREGLDSGCAIEQLAGFHEIFQPGRRPGTPVSLASYRAALPCEVLRPATPCVVACSSGGYGERLSISMLVSELLAVDAENVIDVYRSEAAGSAGQAYRLAPAI